MKAQWAVIRKYYFSCAQLLSVAPAKSWRWNLTIINSMQHSQPCYCWNAAFPSQCNSTITVETKFDRPIPYEKVGCIFSDWVCWMSSCGLFTLIFRNTVILKIGHSLGQARSGVRQDWQVQQFKRYEPREPWVHRYWDLKCLCMGTNWDKYGYYPI